MGVCDVLPQAKRRGGKAAPQTPAISDVELPAGQPMSLIA